MGTVVRCRNPRLLLHFLSGSLAILIPAVGWAAPASPTHSPLTFTYQGRLLNEDGTAPLAGKADLVIGIYSPDGQCLLYEQKFTSLDLTATAGHFSVAVGSELADNTRRTTEDPGLSMESIFKNGGTVRSASTPNCAPGYSAQAGDKRKLRVTVTPESTGIAATLTPDHDISSVPYALAAASLEGKKASEFAQLGGTLTQTALDNLTKGSAQDASDYHNHDRLYLKATGTPAIPSQTTFGLGSFTSAQASSISGSAGQIYFNSTSNRVEFFNGTASQAVCSFSGTPANGDVLKWNGSAWVPGQVSGVGGSGVSIGTGAGTAMGADAVPVCAANQKLQMSAGPVYTWSCVADQTSDTWPSVTGGIAYTGGNVGIGTTAPEFPLTLSGAADRTLGVGQQPAMNAAGSSLTLTAGRAKAGSADTNGGDLIVSSGIATGSGGSRILFQTSGNGSTGTADATPATQMMIDPWGGIGIGTTDPQAWVQIGVPEQGIGFWGTGAALYVDSYGGSIGVARSEMPVDGDWLGGYSFGVGQIGHDTSTASIEALATEDFNGTSKWGTRIAFRTSANSGARDIERMTILGNGTVGIGTSNPNSSYKLDVNGAINATSLYLNGTQFNPATSSTFAGAATFSAAGTGLAVTNNATVGGTLSVTGATTHSGNTTIGTATAATSGTGSNSSQLVIAGNYWNGSASTQDKFTIQDVVGSGTNGTSLLQFNHSGTSGNTSYAFMNGNVGIGTTAPEVKLHVYDSSQSTSNLYLGPGDVGGRINFSWNDSVDEAYLSSKMNGNYRAFHLGASPVEIYNTTTTDQEAVLRLTNSNSNLTAGMQIGGVEFYTSDSSTGGTAVKAFIRSYAESTFTASDHRAYLAFGTGKAINPATEAMRIDGNGNVGIGTTAPTSVLTVKSGSASTVPLTVQSASVAGSGSNLAEWKHSNGNTAASIDNYGSMSISGGAVSLGFLSTGRGIGSGWDDLYLSPATNYNLIVNTSGTGKVGIGTTNPTRILHISSTGNGASDILISDTSQGADLKNVAISNRSQSLQFGTQNDATNNFIPLMTILRGGNVGIGTISPGAKLEVNGGIRAASATAGAACSPLGAQAYDGTTGAPLYCSNSAVWTAVGGSTVPSGTHCGLRGAYCANSSTPTYFGENVGCQGSTLTATCGYTSNGDYWFFTGVSGCPSGYTGRVIVTQLKEPTFYPYPVEGNITCTKN